MMNSWGQVWWWSLQHTCGLDYRSSGFDLLRTPRSFLLESEAAAGARNILVFDSINFSYRLQMRALASSGLLLLACASQATWAFNLGARFLARTGGRQSGLWRRPLSSSPLPDDPPFRIGHGFDIHRLEPGKRPYA